MPLVLGDLKCYGSASMPDDDTPTDIGGAIDLTRTVEWVDFGGTLQAVSSTSADTVPTISVTYRDVSGAPQTLSVGLNGTSPVTNATIIDRLLKAIKSGTTVGDIALENQAATRTGTAQGGTANAIVLDAGASAVDDFYRDQIVRRTNQSLEIRQIVSYIGASRTAIVDRDWVSTPDSSSTFRVSAGMYFAKLPAEVLEARRPFFEAAADPVSGKTYYEKVFLKNANTLLALSAAVVKEFSDPTGDITFALETTKNGTGTNGGGNNRQVAPSAGVTAFDNADKNVPTGVLGSTEAIGVWLKLTLAAGATAANSTEVPQLQGTTV